jgi:hypothetical protein
MLKQIDITVLMAVIRNQIQENSGVPCYDAVPKDAEVPFYFLEFQGSRPQNSKTFYRQAYNFAVHCIAEESPSSVPVLELIRKLEESLSDDIVLPCFELENQIFNGVQTITKEETGEKHAVASFTFVVRYGFKVKI